MFYTPSLVLFFSALDWDRIGSFFPFFWSEGRGRDLGGGGGRWEWDYVEDEAVYYYYIYTLIYCNDLTWIPRLLAPRVFL